MALFPPPLPFCATSLCSNHNSVYFRRMNNPKYRNGIPNTQFTLQLFSFSPPRLDTSLCFPVYSLCFTFSSSFRPFIFFHKRDTNLYGSHPIVFAIKQITLVHSDTTKVYLIKLPSQACIMFRPVLRPSSGSKCRTGPLPFLLHLAAYYYCVDILLLC